ncbi:MAG TPA: MBL fold metallo-hydrolase [Opitutaceae bacterium]|jgi:Cft2 family RNA processing exonuclease
MKLIDLNRDGGIGANSLFIQLGDLNILIDSGLHPKLVGRRATPDHGPLRGINLDLIIITHCHLDHIGTLPIVMREHPRAAVIMTSSSRMLVERMLHNSVNVMLRQRDDENVADYPLFTHEEIDRMARRLTPVAFNQPKKFRGLRDEIELILYPAGHVAGAAGVEIRHKHRALFFTGDVLFDNQRTLPGAKFPAGHFDTLVTETTRGLTERLPEKSRAAEMARLIESINDTIRRGGSFLIPVFALGRMQEILSIVHDARRFQRLVDCPIYASGLGMDLVDYFDEISRKTKHLQFSRGIVKELKIRPLPRVLRAGEDPKQNALYIISSGMLVERTPSYVLASGLVGNAGNTIGFVGYCDPDTPGGRLLAAKTGDTFLFETSHVKQKVRARIERFELSGHADRDELLQFAVQTGARSIVLTHGDPPARAWFAQQLASALPTAKVIDPVPLQPYLV